MIENQIPPAVSTSPNGLTTREFVIGIVAFIAAIASATTAGLTLWITLPVDDNTRAIATSATSAVVALMTFIKAWKMLCSAIN